jgi:hypothetical protein
MFEIAFEREILCKAGQVPRVPREMTTIKI